MRDHTDFFVSEWGIPVLGKIGEIPDKTFVFPFIGTVISVTPVLSRV